MSRQYITVYPPNLRSIPNFPQNTSPLFVLGKTIVMQTYDGYPLDDKVSPDIASKNGDMRIDVRRSRIVAACVALHGFLVVLYGILFVAARDGFDNCIWSSLSVEDGALLKAMGSVSASAVVVSNFKLRTPLGTHFRFTVRYFWVLCHGCLTISFGPST